jgi:hypothetical protein
MDADEIHQNPSLSAFICVHLRLKKNLKLPVLGVSPNLPKPRENQKARNPKAQKKTCRLFLFPNHQ